MIGLTSKSTTIKTTHIVTIGLLFIGFGIVSIIIGASFMIQAVNNVELRGYKSQANDIRV